MIFDLQSLFSNAQAITATAISTNVIDQQLTGIPYGNVERMKRDLGKGAAVPLLIQVVESFNTLTSLTITIETSDDPAFGSGNVVLWTSTAIALANLVAGYRVPNSLLPEGLLAGSKRYLAVRYTVTGTAPTLGKVTAGIVLGVQTNE